MDAASNRASQARRNGGNFGRTLSRIRKCTQARGTSRTFDFPASNIASAEGPGKRQSRSSAGFLNFWWRFFGSSETPPCEDPKTHQVAHWRWRFFGSRGKKTTGGSDWNVSPPSDNLTKRRSALARQLPALASLACTIGLQRGESGTEAECIHVGIWDAPQQGLHLNAPA